VHTFLTDALQNVEMITTTIVFSPNRPLSVSSFGINYSLITH